MDDANSPLDDSLLSTLEMLWCAFDNGIGGDDYWPLIALLGERLNPAEIAKVMSVADAQLDYLTVRGDAAGFQPEHMDWAWVDWMRERLLPCGYERWAHGE